MAFGPSGSGARRGAMYAIAQQQEGMNKSLGALDAGYNTARTALEGGKGFLSPLYGTATQGFNAYADRAGINGAEGDARAMEGFNRSVYGRAGEDYGTQGVMRNASRMGITGSGNTMAALGDFLARNRAQNYTTFAQLAAPYNAIAPQLGSAMAGQQAGLADLAMRDAQNRAGIYTNTYNNMGQTGGNAFAASDQTRQQITNLGMGLASLGLQGLGMFTGGAGGLGKMFSGALSTLGGAGGGSAAGYGGFMPLGYQ